MTLQKDSLITENGGLHQLESGYINWRAGDSTITLDGDFTVAELQWLVDYILQSRVIDKLQ